MALQATRDHGDLEVRCERLAELRQELRRGLDPRPVVLVENQ